MGGSDFTEVTGDRLRPATASGWFMVEDGLTEKFIELVVCADPKSGNHISAALADSAILCAGPYRPNVLITAKLLELKRRVVWILFEKPIRFARRFPGFIVVSFVRAPKARTCERFHSRLISSGDSPSAADSRTKASSFGRGLGLFSNSSQRSSSTFESSRSLLSTARRSASLSFGSSLIISGALPRAI